jgi:signal transduction histidine kinase
MIKEFIRHIEKRAGIHVAMSRFSNLFAKTQSGLVLSSAAFAALIEFIRAGEPTYQHVAAQIGVRWSDLGQKITLRNALAERGLITPACLWAYRLLRGNAEELLKDYASPDMAFMQIALLKEVDPALAIPFLVEKFFTRKDIAPELCSASRLCILRHLDSGISPQLLEFLSARYPSVDLFRQWRQTPTPSPASRNGTNCVDFHQLVRSINDVAELSSISRVSYLLSCFYVPVTQKEWKSLFLCSADEASFKRLKNAGMIDVIEGGLLLSADLSKLNVLNRFLFEQYPFLKETLNQKKTARQQEERRQRVRASELDRQALELVAEGIICLNRTGLLYYINPAGETLFAENPELVNTLFGAATLDLALKSYAPDDVSARVGSLNGSSNVELFGSCARFSLSGKRFEVRAGSQIVILRDITDQFLIDQEIGKLYRHELNAALEVIGIGIETVDQLMKSNCSEDACQCLDQIKRKTDDLAATLAERMDFIRLHSDAFHISQGVLNLNLVVDKCIEKRRDHARQTGITLVSNHLEIEPVQITGEERFLIRAIDNIIRNAIKFCQKEDEIRVTISTQKQAAVIKITDTGPGISKENMGRIFQLGFTTNGTGRGLYITRRIIGAHKGKIDVKSKLGAGACFTLRMPLVREQ